MRPMNIERVMCWIEQYAVITSNYIIYDWYDVGWVFMQFKRIIITVFYLGFIVAYRSDDRFYYFKTSSPDNISKRCWLNVKISIFFSIPFSAAANFSKNKRFFIIIIISISIPWD